MACPNCGKEIKSDANFCNFCGHSLKNTETKLDQINPSSIPRFTQADLEKDINRYKNMVKEFTQDFIKNDAPNVNLTPEQLNQPANSKVRIKTSVIQPSNYDPVSKFVLGFFTSGLDIPGIPKSQEPTPEHVENLVQEFSDLVDTMSSLTKLAVKGLSMGLANLLVLQNLNKNQATFLYNSTKTMFSLLEKGNYSYHGIALSYYFLILKQVIPLEDFDQIIDQLKEIFYDQPSGPVQSEVAFTVLQLIGNMENLPPKSLQKVEEFYIKEKDGYIMEFCTLNQSWWILRQVKFQATFGQLKRDQYVYPEMYDDMIKDTPRIINKFNDVYIVQQALAKVLDLLIEFAALDLQESRLQQLRQLRSEVNYVEKK